MESTPATGRPRASGIAAFAGVVTTLVLSTVVFVAFLIVPIIVLGLALLAYYAWPSGSSRKRQPAVAAGDADVAGADLPAYRFGTGG